MKYGRISYLLLEWLDGKMTGICTKIVEFLRRRQDWRFAQDLFYLMVVN